MPRHHSILALLLTASALPAQTHNRTALIVGQEAELSVNATASGELAAFILGFGGTGSGTCFPAPLTVCLDLLNPWIVLGAVPVDAAGQATITLPIPASAPLIPVASQVLLLNTTTLAARTSNVRIGSIEALSALSDEFAGAALGPEWQIHNPQLLQSSVSAGELHMHPTVAGPAATWFAGGEGPLIFKLLRGDFSVSTRVRAYDTTQPGQAPAPEFRMGGISVRDPNAPPGGHNWLHVSIGSGRTGGTAIAVEDKNTVNSRSNLRLTAIPTPSGEVRVSRVGTMFSLYYRATSTAPWQLLRAFNRPAMPQELQVGLMVYSWQQPNHVGVSYEYLRFW